MGGLPEAARPRAVLGGEAGKALGSGQSRAGGRGWEVAEPRAEPCWGERAGLGPR